MNILKRVNSERKVVGFIENEKDNVSQAGSAMSSRIGDQHIRAGRLKTREENRIFLIPFRDSEAGLSYAQICKDRSAPFSDSLPIISMKRLSTAFVCLGLWLLSVSTLRAGFILPEGARSVSIPVEIRHNVVLLPIRVNGTMELNFILDTGVRTTILTEPLLVNFLQFDSIRKVTVRGLGEGDPIEADMARNVQMELPGGVVGHNLNLLVLPEGLVSYSNMFGKPVYGIIGYELFGRFGVEINYQQEFVRLWNPFEMRKFRRWERLPIQVRKGKPYVQATLTDQNGLPHEEDWLLDTGASMALSLFDEELNIPAPSIESFLGKGLSGNVYGHLSRMPAFQLGPYKLEGIITGFPDIDALGIQAEELGWYGNIGAEVISRFRIVFDYPHRQIIFRKTWGYRRPFEYNVSGLELITMGTHYNTFVISYVRPESPAAKVGIQVNDEIVSVNGNPVEDLSIEDIYGRFHQRRGKTVVIKVRRGNRVFDKRIKLISEI